MRDGPQHEYGVAAANEVCGHGLGDIVQNSDNPQHRRGINALAAGLVVERYVAASDGRAKNLACRAYAINRRRELRHDLRLLRVAKVEAVCRGYGRCATHCYLARRLCHSMHRP